MTRRLIVAVDGPAAAGKGTLARALAAAFDLPYLDTGLLYRAVGRRVVDLGIDPAADPDAVATLASTLAPADLDRTDLRTPEIDRAASAIAGLAPVRAALLSFQRGFGATNGAVLDGRDIGTVIFPDATVKLFVTASPAARALRRWRQLHGPDSAVDAAAVALVAAQLQARDAADSSRSVAPLVPAADAIRIDSDRRDAAEVLAEAKRIVRARIAADT